MLQNSKIEPPSDLRLRRWQAALGALFLGGWALFHLVEQGALLRSREAWLERTEVLSRGPGGLYLELLLGLLPLLAWILLSLALLRLALLRRRRGEAESHEELLPLAEDPPLARALLWLSRGMALLLGLFLIAHILWWWLPKLGGEPPLALYRRLREGFGRWPGAALHAVGISALAIYLWAAGLRLLSLLGLTRSERARKAARWILGAVSLTLWVLYAELAGWLVSGEGTFFPVGG